MSSKETVDAWRHRPYVGAQMRLVVQWVWDSIFDAVNAAGFHDLTRAHVGVFRYPGPDGLRPSELAAQMEITKQSVNDLLGHLEAKGYLTREPDADDRRARVVRLTPRGRRLQSAVLQHAMASEDRIADLLGPSRFAEFSEALDVLSAELFGANGAPTTSAEH